MYNETSLQYCNNYPSMLQSEVLSYCNIESNFFEKSAAGAGCNLSHEL